MFKLNGIVIKPTIFSDQTSQIWKLPDCAFIYGINTIEWTFHNEGEFIQIAQLKHLLDSKKLESDLWMRYLPYARQDKEVSNETTFALRSFAKLINSLNFKTVFAIDPHSIIPNFIINNFIPVTCKYEINKVISTIKPELLCYPDKGAKSKYSEFLTHSYVYADKIRNQLTGEIEGITLNGDVKDKSVLIVDDICDGGGTFIGLTKELLAAGARKVNLYVTHGIFSKGLTPLTECGISRVFTKDGEMETVQGQIVYKEI